MKKFASVDAYQKAWEEERLNAYPMVDAFEARYGYEIDKVGLDSLARVLACPVKANPPNWQHGRVLYTLARKRLDTLDRALFVDIGTAKGFSAVIMSWALHDAKVARSHARVCTVDVIDPKAAEIRNTVAEAANGGPLPLLDIMDHVTSEIDRQYIEFYGGGSAALRAKLGKSRVHLAFVDGKHNYHAVAAEADWFASVQQEGDIILFDDVQIPEVFRGAMTLPKCYALEQFSVCQGRRYLVAIRGAA